MTAVSSSSVSTVSKVGGCPASAWPSVSVPSIGDAAAGSAVITKKCSQPSVCSKPAYPSCADRQLGRALEAEVGLRVGVGEVVGHLAALEQHVERDDGRAGLEDAVVDDREVRQVRAAQRHLVAGLDAARDQQVGDLVGGAVDLGVGQPGVAEDDGRRGRGRLPAVSSSRDARFGMSPTYSSGRRRASPSARRASARRALARGSAPASREVGAGSAGRGQPPGAPTRAAGHGPEPPDDLALGAHPAAAAPVSRSAASSVAVDAAPACRPRSRPGGASSVISIAGATPTDVSSSQVMARRAARRHGRRASTEQQRGLPLRPVARVDEVVEGHLAGTAKSTRRPRTAGRSERLAGEQLVGLDVARAGALDDLGRQRRRRVAGRRGPSRTPARAASCGRSACRTTAARGRAATRPAGQNRRRVGGEHLVGEHGRAVGAAAELELGVGQDDAALAGDLLGPAVDRQGQLAQLGGRVGADGLDDRVVGDVLVVVAERRPWWPGVKIGSGSRLPSSSPAGSAMPQTSPVRR